MSPRSPAGVAGELDLLGRIEVEIALRGDVGGVGPVEAEGEEEGPLRVLLQEADGGGGAEAVGLLGVAAVGGQPAQGRAEAGAGLDAEDLRLVVLVPPPGVDDLLPGRRVVQPVRADLVGDAVMEELADPRREVPVPAEPLGQGVDLRQVLPEAGRVLQDPGGVRPAAGQERRPARVAERELAIGPLEPDPPARQPVDVRRADERMPVAPERGVQVVRDDQEDVEPGGLGGRPLPALCDPGEAKQGEGDRQTTSVGHGRDLDGAGTARIDRRRSAHHTPDSPPVHRPSGA